MNRSLQIQFIPFLKNASMRRGAIFGSILIFALLSFELFNFGTTSFALRDILGDLTFGGIHWSTMLAFAFCGIDFAGIARMFTPEQGREEPQEVWYLFGAWLLAAGFNASLTWWGVAVAVRTHNAEGSLLVGEAAMMNVVPVMVAAMVWLIRVLIIGTFSVAGERLFSMDNQRPAAGAYRPQPAPRPQASYPQPAYQQPVYNQPTYEPLPPRPAAPKPRPNPAPAPTAYVRPEPTYHPVGMSAMNSRGGNSPTRR